MIFSVAQCHEAQWTAMMRVKREIDGTVSLAFE